MPLQLAQGTLTGSGQALLTYTLVDGSEALGATISPAGAGAAVVLLDYGAASAGAASGFGVAAHLLARIANDTAPLRLASNVTTDGSSGGVQLLTNRLPWGWVATLINNNGVTKQPNSAAMVDASQGRAVTITLAAREGAIASAWVSDGGSERVPLTVLPGAATVTVEVEAGGLRVVGLVLVGV